MPPPTRQRLRLSGGTELSFITAGEASNPALLLLHGFPHSTRYFREVIPALSDAAYVIAPDLPGSGESDVLSAPSFHAFARAITELLDHLGIGQRYIYLHDWGAAVGFEIAMEAPEKVLGLVIQNANAHRTGFGPQWAQSEAFWAKPTPQNEAKVFSVLTFEGTRDQYIGKVPPDVAARMPAESWERDWRVMSLPGRIDTHRALLRDYGRYADRFDEIAKYLSDRQPPALLLWGRHDAFFEIAEVLSWLEDLPRMEAHIFDAAHLMLETHSTEAAALMLKFIRRNEGEADG